MTTQFLSNNKGAMRILETVIAATIILLVFTAATFLIQSSNVKTSAQTKDLDSLGYNVLTQSLNSGLIEKTVENVTIPQTAQIRTRIQNALPLGIYYNFTIAKYESNSITNWVSESTSVVSVNNVDDDSTVFSGSAEVSSTPTIYTSKNGNTYTATLVLVQAGGQ